MALVRVELEDWESIDAQIQSAAAIAGQKGKVLVDGEDFKDVFCAWWPTAKEILETIAELVKKIGWLVKILVAVLDKLHKKLCPAETSQQ